MIKIVFHGGEPLLQNKIEFDAMCSKLVEQLSGNVFLQLGIQTNGISLNNEWLELFSKYKISPGVSIDGPKAHNDLHRKDFRGKGTHDRVAKGIRNAQEYVRLEKINGVSTITVIDTRCSAKEIFIHLVDELGIKAMNFLLPDYNHDTFSEHQKQTACTVIDYGKFMCELYDTWISSNDESIDIVFLKQITCQLIGSQRVFMADTGPITHQNDFPILTIYHDGSITPDDTFLTTNKQINQKKMTVLTSTLDEFVKSEESQLIQNIRKNVPEICKPCEWVLICNGGASVNRYSKENGFDNASVYCDALKMIYTHISNSLQENNIQTFLCEKTNEAA
jgi:uncharacterized protein